MFLNPGAKWLMKMFVWVMVFIFAFSLVAAAKVKITYFNFYYQPASDAPEQEIIKMFEQKHPDIEVEKMSQAGAATVWEKAAVMAAGGTPPDIVVVSMARGLTARRSGLLLDLKPFIERDNFEMRRFRPGWELTLGPDWAWGGKVLGIPFGFGIYNLFYNRSMFQEAGLAAPYKGWTKAVFIDAAKHLTRDTNGDGQPDIFGVNTPSVRYTPWPFIDGGDFADPDTGKQTVDDPRFIKGLEFIRDIQVNYNITSSGDFMLGKVGMTHQWDSYIPQLLAGAANIDWSVTWIPRGEAMSAPVSYGQGHVMSIMAGSKQKEAAWEFVKFYYSNEAQEVLAKAFLYPMTQYGMQAVSRHLTFPPPLDKMAILAPYSDVGALKTFPWWVPGMTEALDATQSTFTNIVRGQLTIAQWVENFKTEFYAAASQYK